MNENEEIVEPFKVFVKIRPFTEKEKALNQNKKNKKIVLSEENLVFVLDPVTQEFYVHVKTDFREKRKKILFLTVFLQKRIQTKKSSKKL
jgi:hypothetical protein